MNRKNNGHESAAPERARHLAKDSEEENRGGAVKQHVGQMMPARIQAIKLAVQHVGKPCDRVPVR